MGISLQRLTLAHIPQTADEYMDTHHIYFTQVPKERKEIAVN